ncbi:hypothetical protein ACEUAX_15795, partial [Aeromonas veronii]
MRCCRIKLALFYASPSINLVNSRTFYLVFIGIYDPSTLKRQRSQLDLFGHREFNFEVQFPIKNQAAFRSSSKTTCGCLNPKHLRGLKFSRFS